MKFFGYSAPLSLFALLLAACGGAQQEPAPATAPNENPQQTEPATDTPSGDASPAPTADTTPPAAEAAADNPFADLPAPYNTADYARGQRTYKLCVSCHLLEENAGHRVGPNLHGLFTRKVGEAPGFAYSDALLEADFDWTPEQLEDWLANPRTFLPGNRMSFSGVRRPDDRTAVIAYLILESGGAGPAE